LADRGSQNYGIAIQAEISGGIVHNITIENNIINRSASTRSETYPYGIGVKGVNRIRDITIKHNTIYISGGTAGPYCACFYATARNALRVKVANNIFIHKGTSYPCVKIQNYDSTDTNFMFYNNLYKRLDGSTWRTWFPDTTNVTETTAVVDDPECVDVSTGNFHLNNTSPAIDAANSNYVVSTDYDGRPRPQDRLSDIGAYEYYTDTEVSPVITNVEITPTVQQSGGHLNICCSITDNGGIVDDVKVNITYPDHTTKNFTMNPKYYLDQTYSQIGTYQIYIYAKDSNGRSSISEEYTFQIIPVLTRAFLVGVISDDFDYSGSLISIKAQYILFITFNPFRYNIISPYERIFVSKEYMGYINTKFIIGMFNAAVLSEKGTNDPHNHRILNHLNWDT
jgi:hypothetical protein